MKKILLLKGKHRTITKYHRLLGYTNLNRETLIDCMLYMKMFIPVKEYKHFINEIINEFDTLKKRIHNNAFIKVCKDFGLDTRKNYVICLTELKNNSHIINYANLFN